MARTKNNRNISFQPLFKSFIPSDRPYINTVKLLDEEIEAIYLMDVKGCYQENAAAQMEVSRPTFTRILKNARKKLASAIVSGSKIEIESKTDNFMVAVCSDKDMKNLHPMQEFIYIFLLEDTKLRLIKKLKNPAYEGLKKVAQVLPEIFSENKVTIFITSKIGEGLKNSLIAKGISIDIKKTIDQDNFIL